MAAPPLSNGGFLARSRTGGPGEMRTVKRPLDSSRSRAILAVECARNGRKKRRRSLAGSEVVAVVYLASVRACSGMRDNTTLAVRVIKARKTLDDP